MSCRRQAIIRASSCKPQLRFTALMAHGTSQLRRIVMLRRSKNKPQAAPKATFYLRVLDTGTSRFNLAPFCTQLTTPLILGSSAEFVGELGRPGRQKSGLKTVMLRNGGRCPPNPLGFVALVPKRKCEGMAGEVETAARPSASVPGSALELLPSRALSSAQAESHGRARAIEEQAKAWSVGTGKRSRRQRE